MRNPFNKRKDKRIYDYQTCLDGLADDLERLCDHIVQHDFYVGNERDAMEIVNCVSMIRRLDTWNDAEWDALFDYMKENMRKWWC